MSVTLPKPAPSITVDTVDLKMAKVSRNSQAPSIALTLLVKDALMQHYGSLKAAAITLGMDLGQLSRELQTGDFKLKRLDVDEEARRFVIAALYEAVRDDDPAVRKSRAFRRLREAVEECAEACR